MFVILFPTPLGSKPPGSTGICPRITKSIMVFPLSKLLALLLRVPWTVQPHPVSGTTALAVTHTQMNLTYRENAYTHNSFQTLDLSQQFGVSISVGSLPVCTRVQVLVFIQNHISGSYLIFSSGRSTTLSRSLAAWLSFFMLSPRACVLHSFNVKSSPRSLLVTATHRCCVLWQPHMCLLANSMWFWVSRKNTLLPSVGGFAAR